MSVSAANARKNCSAQRAEAGLTGWIDCFPKSRLAGTLFCGGVADPRAINGHSKLNEAYEMGLHC